MSRVIAPSVLSAFAALILSGCAHHHLRWNTVEQGNTLADIYEQQVLDNLARAIVEPGALPSFAYPDAGGSDVTDTLSGNSDTSWNAFGFTTQLLKISGSRGMKEAWILEPVYDVRRLELMRCAYQQALAANCHYAGFVGCPDCDKLQRTFYTGSPSGRYNGDDQYLPDTLSAFSTWTGRTTPACFQPIHWLMCGKSRPKGGHCLKTGHYCGTYVWVLPGGQEELTKLTLTILDYAFSPQAIRAPGLTKDVTLYFDKSGEFTTPANASQVMKATLKFGAKVPRRLSEAELSEDPSKRATALEQHRLQIDQFFESYGGDDYLLPPILPPQNNFSPLQLELYRDFLTPRETRIPQ